MLICFHIDRHILTDSLRPSQYIQQEAKLGGRPRSRLRDEQVCEEEIPGSADTEWAEREGYKEGQEAVCEVVVLISGENVVLSFRFLSWYHPGQSLELQIGNANGTCRVGWDFQFWLPC